MSGEHVDRLMLPFLLKLCVPATVLAGMVQAGFQFGGLGSSSGQTGNIVKLGQAVSRSFLYDTDGKDQTDAWQLFLILFQFTAGNMTAGAWTNHDRRKTLKTSGQGLILVGVIVLVAAYLANLKDGLRTLKNHIQQLGSFAMGLQNGILVATTGWVNTVTTSGSITDIGLLLGGFTGSAGQALEDKKRKCRTLLLLVGIFVFGAALGGIVFYIAKDMAGIQHGVVVSLSVPGIGLILCGAIAMRHSHVQLSRITEPEVERTPATATRTTADHHILLMGSLMSCFFAGMIDVGAQEMLPLSPTPTHISGPSVKLAMGIAALIMDGSDKEKNLLYTNGKLVFSFFLGALFAGILTNTEARRSRMRGSFMLMVVGGVLVLGVGWGVTNAGFREELQQLCGLMMGFQNAGLCTITNFARTTHMTGNMANAGICLGQSSNPEKVTPGLLFKMRVNGLLTLAFTLGVVVENLVLLSMPGTARWIWIPAFGLVGVAVYELGVDFRLQRKIAVEQCTGMSRAQQAFRKTQNSNIKTLQEIGLAGGFADCMVNCDIFACPYTQQYEPNKHTPSLPPSTEAGSTAGSAELDDASELASVEDTRH